MSLTDEEVIADDHWCPDCGCPREACYCGDSDEEMEDEFYDCGMDRHGNCGKAGSEECDFECPYRNMKKN